ncbi:uncharacterized protein LOC143883379 [Tasmannia lanceolata]|uniref:uncharacterized protein LOC143883379 n=1 Tax=Tasmannia lanceolata TaxID=3420 RepID=UPI004062AC88
MASISEFDHHYILSTDFQVTPPLFSYENNVGMWTRESFPLGDGLLDAMQSETNTGLSDFRKSFPDRFGITEMEMTEQTVPEFDSAQCGFTSDQSVDDGYCCWQETSGHGEKWDPVTLDFPPVYGAGDVWSIQANSLPRSVEPRLRVPRYSVEERKDRILKYLKKRNKRNFNKTIKYVCRKTLADRRRRIHGRFASNNEIHRAEAAYQEDDCQIKDSSDDWYQQALTSLLYSPISAG